MPRQDKVVPLSSCPPPHPDEGPMALILWRLEKLENMVSPIVEEFHRRSGALQFAKYIGAFLVGGAAVAGLFFDHIRVFM